jgi:hypothetical protein
MGHAAAGGYGRGRCSDAMFFQLFIMKQQVKDHRNEIPANFIESHCFIKQVNANVKRIALVLAARQWRGDNAQHDKEGKIYGRYVLWREFNFRLDGGKAMRDFTSRERGVNLYAYPRRIFFLMQWSACSRWGTLPIWCMIGCMRCTGGGY